MGPDHCSIGWAPEKGVGLHLGDRPSEKYTPWTLSPTQHGTMLTFWKANGNWEGLKCQQPRVPIWLMSSMQRSGGSQLHVEVVLSLPPPPLPYPVACTAVNSEKLKACMMWLHCISFESLSLRMNTSIRLIDENRILLLVLYSAIISRLSFYIISISRLTSIICVTM